MKWHSSACVELKTAAAVIGILIAGLAISGAAEANMIPVGNFGDGAPIVGLWQFRATGIAADYGTQAWHADGTELIYSMGPNPATGNAFTGTYKEKPTNLPIASGDGAITATRVQPDNAP